jgi:hypothetical protein
MKYLLLCQFQPAQFANVSAGAEQEMMQAMMAYNQQLIGAGVLVGAGQLDMPHEAVCVTAAGGHTSSTRGMALPGETQIGGYYVVDVVSEDEAIHWAAKCPLAQFGALQVRQVVFSPL